MSIFKGSPLIMNEPYHILWYNTRKPDGTVPTIYIGNYVSIGMNCTYVLTHHNYKAATTYPATTMQWSHGQGNPACFSRGDIRIEHDVWIGTNVTIMDNVHIGIGAVIGAGAVVTHDVPPYAIAAGNPATVVKYRFTPEQIAQLLKTEWWLYKRSIVDELNPYSTDIDGFIERCMKYRTAIEQSAQSDATHHESPANPSTQASNHIPL
jgi:acetyltransferase-like isoleucine patch superfamily enzyme